MHCHICLVELCTIAMIFDGQLITQLVQDWQISKDPETLADILERSQSLIEVIVSKFDPLYRDDLIQEASMKLLVALPAFNCVLGSLHTYCTTVIKNACISWLYKYDKSNIVEIDANDGEDDEIRMLGHITEEVLPLDVLADLIARNRDRFPSLPVEIVDELSEYIYRHLRSISSDKLTIADLVQHVHVSKSIAQLVYYSTLIYLRSTFETYGKIDDCQSELSLMPELKLLLGYEQFRRLSLVFSGMTIKFQ